MTQKREYQLISDIENWTLPFFKASSGFCPLYSASIFESGAALSHGLDLSQERKYRILIIKYMFEAGDNLCLPYNTICIGITYFHKFFQSISIRAHDPYFISTSCLFTAGKQEETRIRLDRCARFLYDYKYRQSNPNPAADNDKKYKAPDKAAIERICKKLAIAELLCTQINKFNYTINLPFDYLLAIISQWKSVYIPHQTNSKTLKYIYCLNAFKFIKESFYIPINILIPPQKIAIVCMELSLRLNYSKYQAQQEEINKQNQASQREYRYIDPPLEWFKLFDMNQNEQDLKDEINLIANEIIHAIQNYKQFGMDGNNVKILKHWRKGTLKTDKVHQQLIEQQMKHDEKFKSNMNINDNNTQLIQYPYNCSNELSIDNLLNTSNNHNKIIPKHRYQIQKQAELSLAFNNQTIAPASLNPHQFFALYPLKQQCFGDVDEEYNQQQKKLNHKRIKKKPPKKKHKKWREESSSDCESSEEQNEDESDEHESMKSNDNSSSNEDELKSNAVKSKKSKHSKNNKNHKIKIKLKKAKIKNKNKSKIKSKSKDRKRKRSESTDKDSKDTRKKRRIERKNNNKNSEHDHDHESDTSNTHSHSHSNSRRVSRKDRRDRDRKARTSSHSHSHSQSHSQSQSTDRDRDRKRNHRRNKRDRDRDRDRERERSASISKKKSVYNKRDRYRKIKKNNIHHIPRYEGGYFTPDPRHNNRQNNRPNNRHNNNRHGHGHGQARNNRPNNRANNRGNRYDNITGIMDINMNGLHGYYGENNGSGGGGGGNGGNNSNDVFDYGLTPNKSRDNRDNRMNRDAYDVAEDGECNDDQLRQIILNNRKQFDEEKTQRNHQNHNHNHNNQEPVSPLLKALKSNKSALYTNMLLPSRNDQ